MQVYSSITEIFQVRRHGSELQYLTEDPGGWGVETLAGGTGFDNVYVI
jgi:hypothetical protein